MLVEALNVYGYYVLMFTLYGIGFGVDLFFKELDLVYNTKIKELMDKEKLKVTPIKAKIVMGLLDVVHHWWLGLLLVGIATVFKPFPFTVLNDAMLSLGFGLASPDIARGIKRFYYNLKKVVKYTKLPPIPEWLVELIASIIQEKVKEAIPKAMENIEDIVGEIGLTKEQKEQIEKKADEIIDGIIDKLLGGGKEGGK